jgi:MFS family permease
MTAPTILRSSTSLQRRLLPLYIAVLLQGFLLWVPVEKLFLTEIGFDPASVGVMAAAYAAVVPIIEIPSGILADRWSRRGVLIISSAALGLAALIGGLSNNVATYIVSALILGVYFAMYSGTLDAVVYDTVLEETGDSDDFEKRIGRVRLVESIALVASSLLGRLAGRPGDASTDVLPERADRRAGDLRISVVSRATTAQDRRGDIAAQPPRGDLSDPHPAREAAPDHWPCGPDLACPPDSFRVRSAVACRLSSAGRAVRTVLGRVQLNRLLPLSITVGLMILASLVLTRESGVLVAGIAQVVLALLIVLASIHVTRLLHDAVTSTVRSGVASGVGALSWIVFLPSALIFGIVSKQTGVHTASWMIVVATVGVGILLFTMALRGRRAEPVIEQPEVALEARSGERGHAWNLHGSGDLVSDLTCVEFVELVTAFLDGALDPITERRLVDHLPNCVGCERYLDQFRQTIQTLGDLPPQSLSSKDRDAMLAAFRELPREP